MINRYVCLDKQSFKYKNYKISPIDFDHRFMIMRWRNDQIHHLRQNEILTEENQNNYFNNIVYKTFFEAEPKQILFSFYNDNNFVGYGGLVHIDWVNKTAEISFLSDSKLNKQKFTEFWKNFLILIEMVAFVSLNFNSIYTYAYDVRPSIYEIFESQGFKKTHVQSKVYNYEGKIYDAIIHTKKNKWN